MVIGLVGGIGAGKSEVAAEMQTAGWCVVDADRVARDVLETPEVIAEVRALFGSGVMSEDGMVDPESLARVVFGDDAARLRLEAIAHPRIEAACVAAIDAAIEAGRSVVLDAPLLIESGLGARCDRIVFVDAPDDVRHARADARSGWPPGEAARRESFQMALDGKRKRSHYVLVNAEDRASLQRQIAELLNRLSPRND